jgi:hypothetical protein
MATSRATPPVKDTPLSFSLAVPLCSLRFPGICLQAKPRLRQKRSEKPFYVRDCKRTENAQVLVTLVTSWIRRQYLELLEKLTQILRHRVRLKVHRPASDRS